MKLTQEKYEELKKDEIIEFNIWALCNIIEDNPYNRVKKQQKSKESSIKEIEKQISIAEYLIKEAAPPNDLICELLGFKYEDLGEKILIGFEEKSNKPIYEKVGVKYKLEIYLESIKNDKSRASKNKQRNFWLHSICERLKQLNEKEFIQARRIDFLFKLFYEFNFDITDNKKVCKIREWEESDAYYIVKNQLRKIDNDAFS